MSVKHSLIFRLKNNSLKIESEVFCWLTISRNIVISSPDERPPFLKGHIFGVKGVASKIEIFCFKIYLAWIFWTFIAPEAPKGIAPQFKEKPKISQDPTGKNVTIECICLASPKPAVTWYRGATVVKDSGRIKISMVQSQDTYTLVMKIVVCIW